MPGQLTLTQDNVSYMADPSNPFNLTVVSSALPAQQEQLVLPNSLVHNNQTYLVFGIGPSALKNTNLKTVVLPENISFIDTTSFLPSTTVVINLKLGDMRIIQFLENGSILSYSSYKINGDTNGLDTNPLQPGMIAGFPQMLGTRNVSVSTGSGSTGSDNTINLQMITSQGCPLNIAPVCPSKGNLKVWFIILLILFVLSTAYIVYDTFKNHK